MIIWTYRFIRRKFAKSNDSGPSPSPQPSPTPKTETSARGWKFMLKLTVALAIPIFLETLDYTVVATAQTNIASVFNRLDLQSYIGTLYLLTSTVFLPLFASIADIYGRHFAMQTSLIFFIFGSALSTGARNMEMMLAGRAIAGIGAAGLLTVVRVILSDSASLNANNRQIGVLFLLYAIGYSVGPVIGGYLGAISFRWIFAINLPACALAIILLFLLLRKHLKKGFVVEGGLPGQPPPTFMTKFLKIDWIGAFFFTAGGILILLALNWGSTERWKSAKVIACFVVGGILFLPCMFWEYILEQHQAKGIVSEKASTIMSAYPMIPTDLFRSYDVVTVLAASLAGGMVMIVMFYFVAIFMTIVNGLDPRRAGVQLVYFAPGSGVGTLLALQMTRLLRQPKYPIILGSLLIPLSLGLISMGVQDGNQTLVNVYLAISGAGCGLTIGSLNVHARFSQPTERVAIVSALILFFRSLGGTIGLAQCGAVLNARVRVFISRAIVDGRIPLDVAAGLSEFSGTMGSIQGIQMLPPSAQDIIKEAFRDGVRWCFISLVPWTAVAFILTLFLSNIPDQRAGTEEDSSVTDTASHPKSGEDPPKREATEPKEMPV
ncbi:MFS general substrate transporter [Marasmius fiardii PR-910]|nr:MFS general substrate transporter [Marasmius fiardii PR-910]